MELKDLFLRISGAANIASASDAQVRDFVLTQTAWRGVGYAFAVGTAEEQTQLLRLCREALDLNKDVAVGFCYDGTLGGSHPPLYMSIV